MKTYDISNLSGELSTYGDVEFIEYPDSVTRCIAIFKDYNETYSLVEQQNSSDHAVYKLKERYEHWNSKATFTLQFKRSMPLIIFNSMIEDRYRSYRMYSIFKTEFHFHFLFQILLSLFMCGTDVNEFTS